MRSKNACWIAAATWRALEALPELRQASTGGDQGLQVWDAGWPSQSPWMAQDLHDDVLNILVAEKHALLMDVSQQPVLIRLRQNAHVITYSCLHSCGTVAPAP